MSKRFLLLFVLAVAMMATGVSVCGAGEPVRRVDVRVGESLLDVQKRVRLMLKENPSPCIDVVLESGEYCLSDGIEFTSEDGGVSESGMVTWRAEKPGKVKIVGGTSVPASQFQVLSNPALLSRLRPEAHGKVLVADVSQLLPCKLPDLPSGFVVPPSPIVFVDGSIGTLARWPNKGYALFSEAVEKGTKDGNMYAGGAFVFNDPRPGSWNFDHGIWLNGYWTHDWDNYSVKAAGWKLEDGNRHVMRLAGAIPYGVNGGTWGNASRRFYAFNVFEELDSPGEWWLDRGRKLIYVYSKDGVSPKVVLSSTRYPLLRGRGVSNLRFCGLTVECGYAGLVEFSLADGVIFENCCMRNTARRGVVLSGRRCRITRCDVSGCGGCAVAIGGGDRKTLTRSDNVVENCRIHNFGVCQRTYAPGIDLGASVGVTVRGNEIFDAPHSAVLYGGNDNLFESNDVHHVLMETGDAGAFYTGRDWTTQGNILRFNKVHDLGPGTISGVGDVGEIAVSGANTMGFYFDDCDCGDAVYSNEFRNIARGIMVGGGRDHPIVGNVFSNCTIGLSIDCRGMTWNKWNSIEHGGPSWMLEEKAKRLDYMGGVWADRYPRLANIMNDHPREPLYNPVVGNTFIDCTGELLLLDKCAPIERMAPIRDNSVVYTAPPEVVRRAKINSCIADGFCVRECQKDSQGH